MRQMRGGCGFVAGVAVGVVALAGCAGPSSSSPSAQPPSPVVPSTSPTPSGTSPSTKPTASRSRSASTTSRPATSGTAKPDPRWHFYSGDNHTYTSGWYAGTGKIMIGFGCTPAPYYGPDPRCGKQGFHHGIDVAMPCGTKITSTVTATVVDPASAGRLGSAYGATGFRLRDVVDNRDIVIGHANMVFVKAGDRVHPGEVIAVVGDRGAPDGCHLHFETRPFSGGYTTAVDPSRLLALKRG